MILSTRRQFQYSERNKLTFLMNQLSPHDTYLKSTKCFNIDSLNHFKRLFMFQTYDTINKKAISIFWKEEININNESIVPLWQAIQTFKYSLNPPLVIRDKEILWSPQACCDKVIFSSTLVPNFFQKRARLH